MIFDSFNNRDWSLFIWGIIFLVFAIWVAKGSILDLLKSLLNKHILTSILLMFGYVILSTYLLHAVELWNRSMIKDLVLWTVGVAFPMFFKANEAAKGKYKLRDALIDNLKLTAFIEFIVNLYVFDLWIELLFVPIMTFVAMLVAYSGLKPEYKSVHKFLNIIVSIVGIILLYHAIKYIIIDFKGFATFNNLESFLFPIAMMTLYMPFIYLMTTYMAYEEFFVRIRIAYRHNKQMERFAKRQVFKKAKLSLKAVIWLSKNLKIYEIDQIQKFKKVIDEIEIS